MSVPKEGWPIFSSRYPIVVEAIGGQEFLSELSNLVTNLVGFESLIVMGFEFGKPPVILYNDTTYFEDQTCDKEFLNALVLDPFYQLIRKGIKQGVYQLEDIAPDEFYSSQYYQKVYIQTGLKKEIGILVPCTDDFCIVLSLGLRSEQESNSDQITGLKNYAELIEAAVKSHFKLADTRDRTIGHQLNDIFSNFGKDFLSERECQVTQLVLQGYSTKSIAPLLDVSTETVKVYRKRIHNKLNISSQSELFSLFLEAASTVPADSDIDPLTAYFGGNKVH
ncbi:helix-turn-helix transcriptional regulator [Vibrio sp. ZSDZ34]|jgi:DNA-binding CsgD family transcriptional regulator|uniref:Helix-turn-helix transcriptional regulator n=1 Tax=Vibrio gelatinilyticus TaxID=2893468 RepID=A0A9X2AVV9_9VIBR|nr:helix-turn-helix transcriptional regulator [Vibrio gelatinilyticus]MCJ2377289.1 helix-turn-helix transcriptional regulator [Vibrio gelatinilyticus]